MIKDESNKTTAEELEPVAAAADKEISTAEEPQETPVAQEVLETSEDYDPKLDPRSPEFDKVAWIEANKGRDYHDIISSYSIDVANFLVDVKTNILSPIGSFLQSERYKAIQEAFQVFRENKEIIKNWLEELEKLDPYLREEIKKPEYNGASLVDIMLESTDDNGEDIPDSLWSRAFTAARLAKSVAEALPQLQSTGTPKYYTSPNTTLINALQANDGKGELVGAGAIDLPVLSVGKQNEVTVYTIATLENMEGVTITGKPFTEFDRAVHDAAVSLYEDRIKNNQPPVMSADMIYRTMTHKTNTEKVSPQQKGAVTKSMDKMRKNISVYADASAEMQRRRVSINGEPVTSYKIDGFLLSADKISIKAGGKSVEAYLLRGEPIMLNYAKLTGQLITVKGKMLDIKEIDSKGRITTVSIKNNENRIAVKSYLLRRVEIMRNDEKRAADALRKYESKRKKDPTLEQRNISNFRNQNHVILFETLFNSTGITAANSQTKTRDYVYAVLDYWKASGDIKDYKKRKKGKTIDAVVIYL